MNRCASALCSLSACCASTLAQSGTATWQVSADDGTTWTSDLTLQAPQTLRVRLVMGWSFVPDALGFGGSQFDGVIQGARSGDAVSNIARPSPFNFAAQTLVATEYADGLKIDTAADTSAPGAGSGWVNPGQGQATIITSFNSSNPAVVFTYTLAVSDEVGTRTIYNIFNNLATGRAMSVYTSNAGAQVRMNAGVVEITAAEVRVIPAPASVLAVLMSGAFKHRRRG
ncbi:MAG: hypothetical protein KGS45_08755 [Planctomycetes bacterium]|nr:hypothetical protein [Planctomycetota bacterium]